MNLYFRIVNPIVKGLLSSPLHRLMSHNTILLQMVGRKSGRRIITPVSYRTNDKDEVECFTSLSGTWWRNLDANPEVSLLLKGNWRTGEATLIKGAPEEALREFLLAVPRDASHSNVRLDDDGQPIAEDLKTAAPSLVLVRIRLTDTTT